MNMKYILIRQVTFTTHYLLQHLNLANSDYMLIHCGWVSTLYKTQKYNLSILIAKNNVQV